MADLPPQNLDAEANVLGSLLLDPAAMAKVAPILQPGDFWRTTHRVVYAAAQALHTKGRAVDLALVAGELGEERLARVGGHAFLAQLADQPSSCLLAEDYAQQVKDAAVRRRLINAGGAVATAAYETDGETALDQARRLLDTIATDAGAAKAPPTFTAAELLAEHFPDARDVVPGIVYEGLTLLASRPKLGKTWLMLGTAVAVAAGGYALGTVKVDQGDVLYLALEDGKKRLQKRLRQLLGDRPAPARLHLATAFPLLDEGGEAGLERWLTEHPEARLVVIDTLKRFRPRERAGASVYNLDYDAVAPLADLAHRFDVAIVVVHHCRKSDAEDPLDLISGTTGLTGGADGAIVLKRARGAADAELHVTHRDAEEDAELAVQWDAQLSGWRLLGDAEEHRRSDQRTAILTALYDAPEPATPKDVAEVLDKPYGAVKFLMWDMAKQGDLKAENGRYTPLAPRPAKPTTSTNPANPANPPNSANPANPPGGPSPLVDAGGESLRGVSAGGGPPLTRTPSPDGSPPGAAGAAGAGRVSGLVELGEVVPGAGAEPWTLCWNQSHAGHARRTAQGEVCAVCHPAPWQEAAG